MPKDSSLNNETERVVPKPATVEDEENTPSSTMEQPSFENYASPEPETAAPSAETIPEQTIYPGSVAEIQRGFEELLINHPRFGHCFGANAKNTSDSHYQQSSESRSCSSTEIPVTRGAAARDKWFAELAGLTSERQNAIRNNTGVPAPAAMSIFSVYCNNCTEAIPDEHYHCSTCDDGDFDLCQNCINEGVLCGGEGHWMIKRFVKNGKVINSTTETIAPKTTPFSESKATLVAPEAAKTVTATRTCNCCIRGKRRHSSKVIRKAAHE